MSNSSDIGKTMIESKRINEIISALGESNWSFIGCLTVIGDLFQCWVKLNNEVYCLAYCREWDAIETGRPGVSMGRWDGGLTAKLRQANEE